MSCFPASADFFFYTITSFYLNVGYIEVIIIKMNDFLFIKVLIVEEAFGMNQIVCLVPMPLLKCYLVESFSVKITHSSDQALTRTPVIIMSNNRVFPKDLAFNDKMFRYNWRHCEFLREYTKYMNSMV